jgi:hypothetical protein
MEHEPHYDGATLSEAFDEIVESRGRATRLER